MRILIVAPNISMRMGGEAVLPYHYIRELASAGHDIVALTHSRVREELQASPLWPNADFHFVEDSRLEKSLYAIGRRMPSAIADTAFNSAIAAVTLRRLGRKARLLAKQADVDVIHQPTPVSPQFPSFLYDMPAPVVIGPMNGGMSYPPAFERAYAGGGESIVRAGRIFSGIAQQAFPGKLKADRILVANERTLSALPKQIDRARVELLVENGVDLSLWDAPEKSIAEQPVFVFVGRLIRLKAVDLLLKAFSKLGGKARLLIIGDGPERKRLEELAAAQNAEGKSIEFLGFRPQTEIRDILASSTALILPSLRDCGGAVILEAFACRTPAIGSDWGGPRDYITDDTGFLIPPDGEEQFVAGLGDAMQTLADNPERAKAMGNAARRRVEDHFTWRAKAQAILGVYRDVSENGAGRP